MPIEKDVKQSNKVVNEDCKLMCEEFGGDEMIDLSLLTASQPSSSQSDQAMVCPISSGVPTNGYWVSMIVDSGAGESVAPTDAFLGYPIHETDASKKGLEYMAAGGHAIVN